MITLRQLGRGTTRLWVLAIAVLMSGAILSAQPVAAQSPPGTTDSVTVTRADGTLSASWNAVDGATSYHVTYSSDSAVSWSLAAYEHTSTSITISGADNSKTYIVAVRARSSSGGGGWRNSAPAGPYTPPPTQPTPTPTPPSDPPAAPSSVAVTRTDGALTATWPAVSGASKYHVTYSSDAKRTWTAASDNHTGTTITISANNGKTYVVAVRAGNAAGWSGWTNSPAADATTPPPAAPASVSVTRADGTLTASWDAVSNATGYHVTYSSDAKQSWSSAAYDQTATSIEISGVDNAKTYYVAVRAMNDAGGSGWTNSDAAGPFNPPAAPTGLSVTPGDGYYDVAWSAVTGATGYDVRAKASGSSTWHDAASNVTGTSYRYTTSQTLDHIGVRARNASGASAWTEVSRAPSNEWLSTVQQFGGASLASAQSQAQGQSQLSAPASITVTRDNWPADEKLNVTWDAVTGADGYNLACTASAHSAPHTSWSWWHCGSVTDGTITTFTIDRDKRGGMDQDLALHRSYAVAVRAVTSNPSDASPWLVSEDAHAALQPYNISVSRAAGSVSLSWTPPKHAQGYEVDCATYATPSQPHTPSTYQPSYTRCADVETATLSNGKINVTISSWTAGGTDYTIDDATTYDIRARTTNAWGESTWSLAPLIYPNAALSVSNIDVTTATLTIGNHTGNWYYKANTGPDASCQARVTGTSEDLTGLSAGTSYTYKAYSDSGCTTANLLATATAFTTLSSVSNLTSPTANAYGPINSTSSQAVAFTTGSNAGGYTLKSITLALSSVNARTSLGLELRTMQGTGDYSTTSQPASTSIAGVTFSGTDPATISFTDTTYTCSGNGCKLSPDTTYFVVATNADSTNAGYRWAISLSETEVALPSNNGWSIGYNHYTSGSSWTTYDPADWSRAGFAFALNASLTSSNVTSSGATLTIANHTGNWYYKATTGPHTTCSSAQSGSTATLTGLTGGTAYTYSAYSDSGCATLLATASAFTTLPPPSLTASDVNLTTATLTVGNHTGQWWYKANAAPHNTCQGPVAANTAAKDLTGLSSYTTYTYKAYSATGCADTNLLATASAFTTGVSASNLSETEASTALNLATDWGQEFTTGSAANGYKLRSVTLDFAIVNPSANITVSIREQQSNNHPATTDKVALTGTPATGQVTFTCSGAGCNLNASTTYFVFVTGGDSVSNMKSTTSDNETPQPSGNGWSIENAVRYQAGGWALHPQGVSMKMKIQALGHTSLAGSSTSSTGATLAVSQHSGNWYYKATTGPHTTCSSAQSGSTATLTGLTAATSYTYTAYSDSACAVPLASASFVTPPGNPQNVTVGDSGLVGSKRNYPVSWGKPAGAQASDAFAYQVQCTNQNNRNTTTWNSCGTHNVASTANATVSRTVQHGWTAPLFYYVRVRAEKNGAYSDWVIQKTQYGS